MKNLDQFRVTHDLLAQVHGGNGSIPVHFDGENAVQQAAAYPDCYCWCACGSSGTGNRSGWIAAEQAIQP